LAALSAGAGVVLAIRPRWAGLGDPDARGLQWLLAGGVLSLPVSLASPHPMFRAMPMLAAAAVIAAVIRALFLLMLGRGVSRRVLGGSACAAALGIYFVASPLASSSEVRQQSEAQHAAHRAIVNAPLAATDRAVLVTSGWWYLWQGKMALALFRSDAHVESWSQIDTGPGPLRVTRPSSEILVLESTGDTPAGGRPWANLGRGEVVPLGPDIRGTVIEIDDAGRARIELTFPSQTVAELGVFAYRDGALMRLPVPGIGEAASW
jgi:hypothetical protein